VLSHAPEGFDGEAVMEKVMEICRRGAATQGGSNAEVDALFDGLRMASVPGLGRAHHRHPEAPTTITDVEASLTRARPGNPDRCPPGR
jgi:hypothetical protein